MGQTFHTPSKLNCLETPGNGEAMARKRIEAPHKKKENNNNTRKKNNSFLLQSAKINSGTHSDFN
jgi:hypothetical protein